MSLRSRKRKTLFLSCPDPLPGMISMVLAFFRSASSMTSFRALSMLRPLSKLSCRSSLSRTPPPSLGFGRMIRAAWNSRVGGSDRTEHRGTRDHQSPYRPPATPHLVVAFEPLGFDQIDQGQSSTTDVSYPVTDRAVVLHIDRSTLVVLLHVGTPVEVGLIHGEPVLGGVVGKTPTHRVRGREHQPTSRPEDPGGLLQGTPGRGHERKRPEKGEDHVENGIRER